MMFKTKDKAKAFKIWLLTGLCLVFVFVGVWLFLVRFEGEPPQIEMSLDSCFLPADTEIAGVVSDTKSGVRRLWIGLLKDGKQTVLLEKLLAAQPPDPSGGRNRVPFMVRVNTKELKISDGDATLIIATWDNSWRNWWKGNRAYLEKDIVFDTKPPVLSVLSNMHNVSQGGSGLVVYRLSEPCPISGVQVGEDFFPGHSGFFQDANTYLAFFALRYDQGADTDIHVKALDSAGNAARGGFYHHVLKKRFKHDTLAISDDFLNWKLPEFQDMEGWSEEASPKDKFIFVNRELRHKNNETILACGKKTEARMFWTGAFGRLPKSARRAGFADHRTYTYHDERIDAAVHMGIDLASVRHAEVPAANAGRVVYSGMTGIYGNLVCIDHGFGLFSVYAHLSRMTVEPGAEVNKGDLIGYTGTTGLAGGDHLHFGMFVDHVFVNPVEWWDAEWIHNNVTAKIENVRSMIE